MVDRTILLEDDQRVFWPYRPRQGYPSAPAWLVVLVLVSGVTLFFVVFILLAEILYHLGLGAGPV